jgi:Ca2+/Na+ antiporter
MKFIYLLALLLLFFVFYFSEFKWVSWILGVLILLIVVSKLFSGAKSVAVTGGKELTRDIESDMMNASPKAPSKEYLTEIARETGRKAGEALAPQEYSYKGKGFVGKLGHGATNFFSGLGKLFRK